MSDRPLLLADIGATNARFAIAGADGQLLAIQSLPGRSFAGMAELIQAYLDRCDGPRPRRAAFAVAGPVWPGQPVHLMNLGWTVTADDLAAALGLDSVTLINDLHAMALCLPCLDRNTSVPVGGPDSQPGGLRVVLAPGTGLGAAAAVPTEHGWIALPGETGHTTLAAESEREWQVLTRLRRRFGDHVSVERLLCGQGLTNLHWALSDSVPADPPTPEEIVARGLRGADPVCEETITLFLGWLGAVAGNLALILNALGGVHLAGGVAQALAPVLADGRFRRRFEAKGRLAAHLAEIPTRLITHPHPALLGLARHFGPLAEPDQACG